MAQLVLTHAQKVTRLYRKSLKNMLSWTIMREVWREDACELREIFDMNKTVDMAEATRLLANGEKVYERHKHPDPYIGECGALYWWGVEFESIMICFSSRRTRGHQMGEKLTPTPSSECPIYYTYILRPSYNCTVDPLPGHLLIFRPPAPGVGVATRREAMDRGMDEAWSEGIANMPTYLPST